LATTTAAEGASADALLAEEYLCDLVYTALLERGEASKISEITLEINNPRITVPAVRGELTHSPRFLTIDRLWDLKARYLDRSRPVEGTLDTVLQSAGRPLSIVQLATELSIIYNRPSEVYLHSVPRAVQNQHKYFRAGNSEYGLTAWLPLVDGENEAEVLSDNKLATSIIAPYRNASTKVGWSAEKYGEATYRLVSAAKRAVPHKILGILAFLSLGDKYDPAAHLSACLADPRLVWLSGKHGGRWLTTSHTTRLEAAIEEKAATFAQEEPEEIAPTPVALVAPAVAEAVPVVTTIETPVETAPVEVPPAPISQVAPPLEVTEADLKAIEAILVERGAATEVSELLGLRYEVLPGDPSYRVDVATLLERLKSDERFQYVGSGRFREANSLPLFVYSIPEYLSFPNLQFVSMDGEIMDEEIEDEGYAGTLKTDSLNPLAQDAGDDEGRYTGEASADDASIRLVVKAHHKDIGAFPLCQIPEGFFPSDATVIEIMVRDPNGETHGVIVNSERDVRLAFNLFGLYEFLGADSGSVFYLHKTARPYEFRFEPRDEIDPQVGIAPERMPELLGLREQAEGGDMATFDIVSEVLESQPKGLDFVQLMTEVNVIRRVTRRKLASILSNYLSFAQKPGQPQWRFDVRKRDLGTDRNKRKYIKR
jgi:hypothetical protein